jgi:ParB/RepB/Spo0J family partition protein
MWKWHERIPESINQESCRSEIRSFAKHGQQIPALGRRVFGNPNVDIELVYGARRLYIARHLRVGLLVKVQELTDLEAVTAVEIENRQRKELTPFERGMSFANWLKAGIFSSQDDIARHLKISASQVSRLLKLAELPPPIIKAFASPLDICENWGRDLNNLWKKTENKEALERVSQKLAKSCHTLPPAAIYESLIGAQRTKLPTVELKVGIDEVVKDIDGVPLFRIREHRRDTALLLPSTIVSGDVMSEIKKEVSAILHRARIHVSAQNDRVAPATLSDHSRKRSVNGEGRPHRVATGHLAGHATVK